MHYIKEGGGGGRKERVYRVQPTSINATTMAGHSGDGNCGSCTSEYSRGFFPLCMLHCQSRVHREEMRGNNNYRVIEEIQ